MESDSTPPELRLSPVATGLFSYHVRMSAVCGIAGNHDESASEALLAWSMLCAVAPEASDAAAAVAAELIDPEQLSVSDADQARVRARAQDLALSLEAHYVSVGLHEHATLYETIVGHLEPAVSALAPPGS